MRRGILIALLGCGVLAGLGILAGQARASQTQAETDTLTASQSAVSVQVVFGTGLDRQTRALTGQAERFPAGVGQVVCFTHLQGVVAPAVVTHTWYHEGKTMAKVELNVGSASWRTWSTKQILPGWTGHWEVKVLDAAGNVLGSGGFELE